MPLGVANDIHPLQAEPPTAVATSAHQIKKGAPERGRAVHRSKRSNITGTAATRKPEALEAPAVRAAGPEAALE